ncbi:MAG: sulfurtransferase-like selenium metabolism protein YedF [bacterium]|nr:sulfurtransferase-like selenium metabolism protein YedF [bacterium]
MTDNTDIVVVFNGDGMGRADAALAHKLAGAFLNVLDLDDRLPRAVCFYGEGVKLTVKGSPVLEELGSLAEKGVELVVCTTCLNSFDIFDDLAVGTAAGMKEIVALQWDAGKVLTL